MSEFESEPVPAAEPASVSAPQAKPTSPALAFAIERLGMNPEATLQEVRDAAALAGLSIHPLVYGRARSKVGLPPLRPRRPKVVRQDEPVPELHAAGAPTAEEFLEATELELEEPAEAALRPARPRTARGQPMADPFGALTQLVRELQEERDRLREALARIAAAVDEALG
ncbi:MAG: hypothetical protein IT458_02555 [Planctomycetes bacterium]|nr:hypothetical protein [Planctomycetota bacterium]